MNAPTVGDRLRRVYALEEFIPSEVRGAVVWWLDDAKILARRVRQLSDHVVEATPLRVVQ